MSYVCFDVEETSGVAHVRLNRPDQLNTMTPDFWSELPRLFARLSDSGRVRAVVLSSTGKHFCAGMDLGVFGEGSHLARPEADGRQRAALRLAILDLQRAITALEAARMPVLAAIQGGCVGGGVDLVTAADCRYATKDAWFCIHEINIGITADLGTLQRLPGLIPEGVAREYAYTGRRLGAERARDLGLVNAVYEDSASMLADVLDIAGEIAARSPLAVYGTKESILYARDHPLPDALKSIAAWQAGMFEPRDLKISFDARPDGREPEYEDLPEVQRGL